ncbi:MULTISPECIES: aldo/keto reductase [unclassified Corynebacterium]|uniref:aldo/keto reductase n=1 Tax=unclassified Corynebacterium TaxID=2624378 RepID=UPI0008A194FC|nr:MULTISPECIES: aldo/keto reductase [unclassified Corynebacterium]MBC6793215.1 aldo/keto reductase [Corynebacterium sp. LK26]OFO26312.1 aldo/keto reductase [Corynebacterium sp. HMSC064E07]
MAYPDVYHANDNRYETMPYNRSGGTGLKLPAITLGLWHNFGDDRPLETQREILRTAFDHGVTHFDLANNYGPPQGSAEASFGRIMAKDFAPYRDEMIISSKAGWYMQDGPYGFGGSRKYLVASCDASLKRMGLDYVDIFYHHRPDPDTPIEETVAALDFLVRSGRALYVGVSSYSPELTRRAQKIARELGTPLTIHQPSYSMFNRWIEDELLATCADEGMGVIAFSALAQGLLTDRYLDGVPESSRLGAHKMNSGFLNDDTLTAIRELNAIASRRGQSLAQMAISWVLRRDEVTSALIGASSVKQLKNSLGALDAAPFSDEELAEIDKWAVDRGINQWQGATESV